MNFAEKDCGLKIEVKPPFERNNTTVVPYMWNDINFELSVNHLNINTIVSNIKKQLINENNQDFEYKYDYQNKLRSTAFAIFWEKFEHCKWFIGETWYCPQQNKYTLEISLQGKRLDYIHHGLLEDVQYIKISNFFLENYPEYII